MGTNINTDIIHSHSFWWDTSDGIRIVTATVHQVWWIPVYNIKYTGSYPRFRPKDHHPDWHQFKKEVEAILPKHAIIFY